MKEQRSQSPCPEFPRLDVKDLCYGTNGPYHFNCRAGQCLGISGASGIGKSLLLRAIADLDEHTGEVLLDGRNYNEFPAPQWRKQVALIPAESRWWYPDVGSHLPEGYQPTEARELAEACGFSEDVLDWEVHRLSTGEKQRLSVIRALLRKPVVLLLDETGSGLDDRNGLMLESVIGRYRRETGAAVVWVSHDREQLERVTDRKMTLYRSHLEPT